MQICLTNRRLAVAQLRSVAGKLHNSHRNLLLLGAIVMHNAIHTPTWVAATALALSLIIGGVTGSVVQSSTEESKFTVAPETRNGVVFDRGFSPVVRSAAPAVVNISSSRVVKTQGGEELNDPFLRKFFGEEFGRQFRVPRERREHSLGSGVIVKPMGYILTNSHVVDGATDIKVALSDTREFDGKIVGIDPGTDIAVIKIDTDHLSTLPFADSSKVEVGDLALAMGNPFGVGRTVTMGIVSAIQRGGLGIEDYEDFIQTDASINPGNSGGALVNVRGELIGINTAILSPSGGNLGIGFAVPSNMARNVMDQIIKTGKVTRGFMGVSIQDITPDLAAAMKLNVRKGALVGGVEPNSPAARAGLQPGDVIVELNGKPVTDSRELRLSISSLAPGTQVSMRVLRNAEAKNITMTLADVPVKQTASNIREKPGKPEDSEPKLGLAVTELTPAIREQLELPADTKGIVVADVQEGSPAAEAGLQPGDVIQEANRKPIQNYSDFRTQVMNRGDQPLLLRVNREGHSSFIAIPSR
jgi:serine protease Do